MITTLAIEGMTCNGCVRHVDAALKKVPGVTAVEVRLADHSARVVHEGPVEPLCAAVESGGYRCHVPAGSRLEEP